MLDLDVYPKKTASGNYIDPWVLPEYQREHLSLFTLRQHLLYEPFAKWVNSDLRHARWLGIYSADESDNPGSSYARLLGQASQMDMRTHPEAALFAGLVRADGKPVESKPPQLWVQRIVPLQTQSSPLACNAYETLLGHVGQRYTSSDSPQFKTSWIQRTLKVGYNQACLLKEQMIKDGVLMQEPAAALAT